MKKLNIIVPASLAVMLQSCIVIGGSWDGRSSFAIFPIILFVLVFFVFRSLFRRR